MNLENLLKFFLKFCVFNKKHDERFIFWYLLSTSLKLNLEEFHLAEPKTLYAKHSWNHNRELLCL